MNWSVGSEPLGKKIEDVRVKLDAISYIVRFTPDGGDAGASVVKLPPNLDAKSDQADDRCCDFCHEDEDEDESVR